ncbi:NAD(P)-dependent alcohol dehydrogenase [Chryseobacterium indologenes]|uniref:NAD(P)-dependent alcohol dehydrogenase n=1 Tax=Chryseobacterium indologenes TaxID=253 RepID=UPI004057D902
MDSFTVKAYGTAAQDFPLEEMHIQRREVLPKDVEIEILYCGVCHTDLHKSRNDWGGSTYPVVPGHEIVGRVTKVGNEALKYSIGDLVAVGCLVDSCRTCPNCQKDLEQYCLNGFTVTYGGADKHLGGSTYGGYAEKIVVDEDFVLKVPENVDAAAIAPVLCAGITVWSPLRHWKVGVGSKVAIIGLGGLGHMGIKLAKGLGAEVTLFSRSAEKAGNATRLGSDHVVISTSEADMKSVAGKFDLIIDTVPYDHDITPYMHTLATDGTLVLVGYFGDFEKKFSTLPLYMRRSVVGSVIGGIAETQELLDFCGKTGIVSDIEMIDIQNVNEAFERMEKGDVRYRFVIDMKSLKN